LVLLGGSNDVSRTGIQQGLSLRSAAREGDRDRPDLVRDLDGVDAAGITRVSSFISFPMSMSAL
jgi:hypothetical protein